MNHGSRNIIIISSIDWDFNWQGPQEIASRFAAEGNRVLFIENTGVRTPGLKDLRRVRSRLSKWTRENKSNGVIEVAPDLYVCSPLVAPPFGSPARRAFNRRIFLPAIKRIADKLGMSDPHILTFLPTDTALDLIKLLRSEWGTVSYYIAGDFEKLVSRQDRLHRSEEEIVALSDNVFTICDELTNRFKPANPSSRTLSYGVNLEEFRNGNETGLPAATKELLAGLQKDAAPVIGYVGAVHRYVNQEMLEECANARPDWRWVFVGPLDEDVSRLKKLPNVMFLGRQKHRELVYFIKHFDVCMIPYKNVPFTETVVPVKLNEYLAVGKPVVSTDIPVVRDFNERHRIIRVSRNDSAEFVAQIDRCLLETDSPQTVEKRKRIAMRADWKLKIEEISRAMTYKNAGKPLLRKAAGSPT